MKSLKPLYLVNDFEITENGWQELSAVCTLTNCFIYCLKFILALSRLEFIMNSLIRAFSIPAPSPST
jgi:hypothetical protein